jgi:hypothetical protein
MARLVSMAASALFFASCLPTFTPADRERDGAAPDCDCAILPPDDAGGDAEFSADTDSSLEDAEACLSAVDAATLTVSVETIVGDVPSCPAGSAHPNVCCWTPGGPVFGQPEAMPLCFQYQGLPFRECGCDALTFPDRRACCPLEGDLGGCVAAPPPDDGGPNDDDATSPENDGAAPTDASEDGASTVGDAGTSTCFFPCGPGGYLPKGDNGVLQACALIPPNEDAGDVDCPYCCTGNGSCFDSVCSCPPGPPGGGLCPCAPPQCGACPYGWEMPRGLPDLCCRSALGATQCFSQALTVLAPQ